MTSLADRKAELVALLGDLDGVDAVWDHLPHRQQADKTSVCVYTDGYDPEFWRIAVRVYKHQGSDPKSSQDELDTLLPAVDAATDNGVFGPSRWDIDYPVGTESQWYVATQVYEVGREDF